MTASPSAVLLDGVKKTFALRDRESLTVLDIARLDLPPRTWTVLKGRSGSGKTTLLNMIAGISMPTSGTIMVHGTEIFALPEAQRDRFRARHVGYVFQAFNLLSAFSALENVMLAMAFADAVPRRDQRRRAAGILSRLGLGTRLSHKPQHLSRGEQQRVAIARALANDPPVILADEPCASLDARTAHDVLAEFVTVCREDGRVLMMVSHDDADVGRADRVIDMRDVNRAAREGS